MKTRSVASVRIAKIGYIVASALLCGVGVLLLAYPQISTLVLARILGSTLLAFGCIKLVGHFSRDLFRLAFQYDLQFGILLIALGLIFLIRPEGGISVLLIAMGIEILADALFKLRIAGEARAFGIRDWALIVALAATAAVFALLLIFRPWESAQALALLMGLTLLACGALNLAAVLSMVKIIHHQLPDEADGWTGTGE